MKNSITQKYLDKLDELSFFSPIHERRITTVAIAKQLLEEFEVDLLNSIDCEQLMKIEEEKDKVY